MLEQVQEIDRCRLKSAPGDWIFAREHAGAIDAHWQQRQAANPAMFNGTIYILGDGSVRDRVLSGSLWATEFKAFLYWKDRDYPDSSVRDVFGSALIQSAEGHVLLGRQAKGNLNAGLSYLPGGFIDTRDVDTDGYVDIAASVAREVTEETGLDPAMLERNPGFLLTQAGQLSSIAVRFRSHLGSRELREAILRHLSSEPEPELADIVIVRGPEDCASLPMPSYARVLLRHLHQAR